LFAALVLLTAWVGARERREAGVRRTRAVLEQYRAQLESHMSAHENRCPKSLEALRESAEIEAPPQDAWGRPLRYACPWELAGLPYLLSSDGPDGLPGGLDRIE
jgi:general secretion pathway protein G